MTDLLAVVADPAEAAMAIAGGADGLVVRCPDTAPFDPNMLARIQAAAGPQRPLSIWVTRSDPRWTAAAAAGAEQVWAAPALALPASVKRWTVIPFTPGEKLRSEIVVGSTGAVIAADTGSRRWLEVTSVAEIERHLRQARNTGLRVALVGSMEMPDIPRLLAIVPDALVLNDVLRHEGRDGAALDPARLRLARDLIPTEPAPGGRDGPNIAPIGPDRIFVRDWIVCVHLGAYSHEHAPQRVRFTVEAEIAPVATRRGDIRDVVTYDLITDAIGRVTAEHVDLVEAIAERVARLVLAHPRVKGVDVSVEKLDLGPGSLGCRIVRRRAG